MAKSTAKTPAPKEVAALLHGEDRRLNIPTAEYQPVLGADEQRPVQVPYARNRDLDPQLVWRGKDEQDWSDLVVSAPPLYIQEKVHAKALIDDLLRQSRAAQPSAQLDLFADFNGIPEGADKTEFYQHEQNWSNRMILGDSLKVMASLAEREGLRGKVQCIYLDPPYGIKFNSNFQWSTTSRDVKDGNLAHATREPEQVKAFRDTWRDGIHSYLTYLRDRLTVARDLLSESGSIFVQIGDENVHLIRSLLNEVFGESNFVAQIAVQKVTGVDANFLAQNYDYILFFAKNISSLKFRQPLIRKAADDTATARYDQIDLGPQGRRAMSKAEKEGAILPPEAKRFQLDNLLSSEFRPDTTVEITYQKRKFFPGTSNHWKTSVKGMERLGKADRLSISGNNSVRYVRMLEDYAAITVGNGWNDISASVQSRTDPKIYVVQTSTAAIQRCLIMTTDPGDLVLDPTCGSGTTAYVAEQWGRRWITIDTSRVALALARARLMGGRFPYYLLRDSREGQQKEAAISRTAPSSAPTYGSLRQGFVYERVPHITLKSIANNTEIDVIWDEYQTQLEPLLAGLNSALGKGWQEWEIPRDAETNWPEAAKLLHAAWWEARIARQRAIDASIAAKAEHEYLYDRPYEDKKKVRVAGPFTVESLSPHRLLGVDENDELIDSVAEAGVEYSAKQSFPQLVLENLRVAGVQQAHKEDKISFSTLSAWPGHYIGAEGRYREGEAERRAAIFIGPEFGTVSRPDLVTAAREASDAGFDVLVACAFSYEAHTTEFNKLGRVPVLKAHMNADLHMAGDLKPTDRANLFVIFGEPDITMLPQPDGQLRVKVNGVDIFKPQLGKVESSNTDEIACWFIDSDYNEESFFVRHAYFLGANDPYSALKTTLKAEINAEAWESLNSDVSRPFPKPQSGRIAVKVINHLGDEVMKVFKVS
jgi:adenine-specific DNA-methyltransferase